MPKYIKITEDPVKTENLVKLIDAHKESYMGRVRCRGVDCTECYFNHAECNFHNITSMKRLLVKIMAGKCRPDKAISKNT